MVRIPGTTFSDFEPPQADPLRDFLTKIKKTTFDDLAKNHSEDVLLRNAMEELGEYAAAKTVQLGLKQKNLKESALIESVDLVICALSLFYLNGGDEDKLLTIGSTKLKKWIERVK